jgi:pimeloyl-ACP methyl ester carboxylesterase
MACSADCALSYQERLVDMITFATRSIEGLSVFYREAGDPHNPTIVLMGGFPSSSHMFRGLMPLLEKQFHLIAPDYPGFGNTDLPDPASFAYTFDHLAAITEQLLLDLGVSRAGWYLQDYGAPLETVFSGDIPTGWNGSSFKTPIPTKKALQVPGMACGMRFGSTVLRKPKPRLKHF